jgi:hypothetical protein
MNRFGNFADEFVFFEFYQLSVNHPKFVIPGPEHAEEKLYITLTKKGDLRVMSPLRLGFKPSGFPLTDFLTR